MKIVTRMPVVAFAVLLVMGGSAVAQVQTPLNPTKIPQFVQPLPLLGTTGIPFTLGDTTTVFGKQLVNLSICEFQTSILPAGTPVVGAVAGVAPQTWVWGYQEGTACNNGVVNHSYLGPVVLAKRGTPTEMTFNNKLPDAVNAKVLAYKSSTDQTLIWGDPLSLNTSPPPVTLYNGTIDPITLLPVHPPEDNLCYAAAQALVPPALLPAPCYNFYGGLPAGPTYAAPIPAAIHIHGGEVPAMLDGGPDSWFTPNGIYGHGYYSKNGVADAAAGKAIYTYPNGGEAAPIWFHDHILGATRLNVYAGIAGAYMITDDQLTNTGGLATGLLPLGLDRNGNNTLDLGTDEPLIPLVIQDRMFDTTGQLYFPAVGINPEHPYWVPEFIGDTIVVNGKAWPYLNVQPKRYRFLVLNGSNARSYELFMINKVTGAKGPVVWVIGNDQGYLDTPQKIDPNAKLNSTLVVMPGERYEVIVDFAGNAGATLELRNSAKAPYSGGSPPSGTTTARIVQFRVAAGAVADTSFNPAAVGAKVRTTPSVRFANAGAVAAGVTVQKKRRLTLNEVALKGGPVEILVNNTLYDGRSTRTASGLNDFTPVTTMWNTTEYSELPNEGETELWEIVNTTADAHPIHPHLVAFQLLNRQAFDMKGYAAVYGAAFPGGLYIPGFGPPLDYNCGFGAPGRGVLAPTTCTLGGNPDPALFLLGAVVPPAPQEIGWKDTIMAPSGMVTRILVRFAKTTYPNNANPDTIGYEFNPDGGHGYVWHCHIIDHEDNEMMRPYTVQENPVLFRSFVKGIDF